MLNRSIICKVANNLRKSGYTLSQAFRMAWKLHKGTASVKVAGVTKGRRQEAIEHLSRYNPEMVSFILNRESDNQYDRNAIAVYASVGSGIAEPHRQKKRQAHISELALWNYATLSDVYSTTAISVIRLLTVFTMSSSLFATSSVKTVSPHFEHSKHGTFFTITMHFLRSTKCVVVLGFKSPLQ